MKIFLFITIFVSAIFASVLEQNFITIDNDSVVVNNDADFYTYINKLNDKNLTTSYEEATRAINRIDNPYDYLSDVKTYEDAFASLRFLYPSIGDKNGSSFIDTRIDKLNERKKLIITELLAANRNKLTDANDIALLIEYFQTNRELGVLSLNKANMIKTTDKIVRNIWAKEYKFAYDKTELQNSIKILSFDANTTLNTTMKAIFINNLLINEQRLDFIKIIKQLQETKNTNNWQDFNETTIFKSSLVPSVVWPKDGSELQGTYEQSLELARQAINEAKLNRQVAELIINYYQQPHWKIKLDKFTKSFEEMRGKALDYTLFIFDNNNIQVSDIVDFIQVAVTVLLLQFIISWLFQRKLRHIASPLALFAINIVLVLYLCYYFATQTLSLSMTNFTIIASTFSLALGFGAQTLIQNFVSGLIIIGEKTIKKGDFITLSDGSNGFVTDVNYRTTTLRTEDNIIIAVPNSKIFLETIQNKTKLDPSIRVKTLFLVDKNSDFVLIEETLKDACKNIAGFISTPEPELVICSMTQGGVRLEFRLFVKNSTYDDAKRITKILYDSLQNKLETKA